MPSELYAHAPEILDHCDQIGKQYGLHDNALFHTRVTDLEWDDGQPVDHSHGSGRRVHGAIHWDRNGAAPRPQAPRHRWHRVLHWPFVPYEPVGLRLHRRRPVRRADGSARRQARRGHRHRRDGRAVRAAPGAGVPRVVRVPAHPILGGRAGEPADGSAVVRRCRGARLARPVARQLRRQYVRRRIARRRLGQRRVD